MLTFLVLGRAVLAPQRLDRPVAAGSSGHEDGFTWWKAIFG